MARNATRYPRPLHARDARSCSPSVTDPLVDFATNVVGDLGLPGIFLLMVLESACIPIPSARRRCCSPASTSTTASTRCWAAGARRHRGQRRRLVDRLRGRLLRPHRAHREARQQAPHQASTTSRSADRWFDRHGDADGVLLAACCRSCARSSRCPRASRGCRSGASRSSPRSAACRGCSLLTVHRASEAGDNWESWKDKLHYVDYAVVAADRRRRSPTSSCAASGAARAPARRRPRPMRRAPSALPLHHAVALGLLHGPAELLPVSSSGARGRSSRWLLGWPYPELDGELRKAFEVALHAGTAAALLVALRHEVGAGAPRARPPPGADGRPDRRVVPAAGPRRPGLRAADRAAPRHARDARRRAAGRRRRPGVVRRARRAGGRAATPRGRRDGRRARGSGSPRPARSSPAPRATA